MAAMQRAGSRERWHMRKLRRLLERWPHGGAAEGLAPNDEERGMTGLETAIILIAFVVVAAVFAFVILSTGLFSSERGKEAVYAGLAKTRGTMTLTGGVIATSDGTMITNLTFSMTLAAGGDSVNLNNTDPINRTVISYIDQNVIDPDIEYTVQAITGNGDLLLQQGELLTVSIDFAAQVGGPVFNIGTNKNFILEIKPPTGSYMVLQRQTPPSLNQTIIDLF
jgi:flagellin FlaB